VLATNDPTAHAEIVAIRDACRRTGSYWLEGAAIYVNCEPCPMCLAAIHWARIGRLYFAATRNDAAAIDFADADIYREVCLVPEKRAMPVQQMLRADALQVMRRWPALAGRRPY
jgi:tRNA(Arg) A34 adenosine deaminase TadA